MTHLDTAAIRAQLDSFAARPFESGYFGRVGIIRGLVRQLCDALDEARAESQWHNAANRLLVQNMLGGFQCTNENCKDEREQILGDRVRAAYEAMTPAQRDDALAELNRPFTDEELELPNERKIRELESDVERLRARERKALGLAYDAGWTWQGPEW
ncbi:MAG TPA: hypothetical protein VGB13_05215, partial [Candidatus Krumholzibacteria bacterium]